MGSLVLWERNLIALSMCLMMVYSAGHVLYKYVGKYNYKSNKQEVIVYVPNNILLPCHILAVPTPTPK